MFERYTPKKFCREFVLARGHSLQLPSVMAVAAGIKPCLDDWVPARRFADYRSACRRYGLLCVPDTVFRQVASGRIGPGVIGAQNLTTTHAAGRPWTPKVRDGLVHVFIARSQRKLAACFREGWYPLIIRGRVVEKPLLDAFRFGPTLGYPDCCCDFFRRRNNWSLYNFLYEIYKNSGPGPYPFLCNTLTRDETYAYVSHMPCSFSCGKTRRQAERIRSVILAEEPSFVRAIDRHLRLPYLVFRERQIYAFDGILRGSRLEYKKVAFAGRQPTGAVYERDLKRGDSLIVEKDTVVILKRGRLIRKITWGKDPKAQRGPRALGHPFLIRFV